MINRRFFSLAALGSLFSSPVLAKTVPVPRPRPLREISADGFADVNGKVVSEACEELRFQLQHYDGYTSWMTDEQLAETFLGDSDVIKNLLALRRARK